MTPCVVDASVVAAAFFHEKHADAARALLISRRELCAPDLIHAELANIIWKRHRRGEIDDEEAGQLLANFLSLPLRITPSDQLVASALKLSLRTGRTVYDCLYLALAVKTRAVLVSGDKRLINALAGGPMEAYITWIGSSC